MSKFGKEYFENYSNSTDYESTWEDLTFHPSDLLDVLWSLHEYSPRSIFDVGAADGSWLHAAKSVVPGLDIGGIEIYSDIIKEPVIQGDINTYEFDRHWDIVYLNSLAYLSLQEVKDFLAKVKFAQYVVVAFERADTITPIKGIVYEKTLLPYMSWINLFYVCGYEVCFHYDPAFVLRPISKPKLPSLRQRPSFLSKLQIHDHKTMQVGKIMIHRSRNTFFVENAKPRDLIQLTYFFNTFQNYSAIFTRGTTYTEYVPGWENMGSGDLLFFTGVY